MTTEDAGLKPVISTVGSVCNASAVEAAMLGVSAVIHVAGVIDVSVFPDLERMHSVNVQGTKNVIDACLKRGISYLVFTSSVSVVAGYDMIIDADESLKCPEKLMFEGYASTKMNAERMVLSANGMKLGQGSKNNDFLRTLVLRPTSFFGEGDQQNVTPILKLAKSCGGVLVRVDNLSAMQQHSYAGNMAWAHVRALYALREDANVGGFTYIVSDDAPLRNFVDSLSPIIESRGFRVSKYCIPFWLVYILFWILEFVLKLIYPIYKCNMRMSLAIIKYSKRTYTFNRTRAEMKLKYTVKYSYSESLKNSYSYYSKVVL